MGAGPRRPLPRYASNSKPCTGQIPRKALPESQGVGEISPERKKYIQTNKKKKNREGHTSVESLKDAYKDRIQDLRKKASTAATPEPFSPPTRSAFQPPPPPKPQSAVAGEAASKFKDSGGIKPLRSYLDVEKILGLPPKEIEGLWRLRHVKNENSVCACIPLDTYKRIASTARWHPQFVLPLPRQAEVPVESDKQSTDTKTVSGADVHFLQWGFHPPASSSLNSSSPSPSPTVNTHTSTVIFTSLGAYKMHGSFAEPHTTITHYLDLADEKGLVLMHGQVTPGRGVSTSDASWLVNCLQRFYDFGGQATGRKGELLQLFTKGDAEKFKIEEVMEETEKL